MVWLTVILREQRSTQNDGELSRIASFMVPVTRDQRAL